MINNKTSLKQLRLRAERALESTTDDAEGLLDELVLRATAGSDNAIFAHRHLAEIRLESDPWNAALHLRHVERATPNDDVVHALMGLCHALLGNYRVAVRCYRHAIQCAPHIPWYHHNLGHLIDVALCDPHAAEPHLRRAHDIEPEHDEIVGSLAHCLARMGEQEEALHLARLAVSFAPKNNEHEALLDWIEKGAVPEQRPASAMQKPAANARDEVLAVLEAHMPKAGFSASELQRAKKLWRDLRALRPIRYVKPEVYAATLEYAIATIDRREGWTQSHVAQRYGIAAKSISTRYSQLRATLSLKPDDPRYANYR